MIKSAEWLFNHLGDENLVVLDASIDAKKERTQQIQGSRFFDIPGKFSDMSSKFPNTMPNEVQFQSEARNLGLNSEDVIIIYDNVGIYSAPRAWYMFKSMGHKEVYVLDGGLPAWKNLGYPVVPLQAEIYHQGNFVAKFKEGTFRSTEEIESNISKNDENLIDARSSGRFEGIAPEPRVELKSGNIPGSINIPFSQVLRDGKYKSIAELQEIFQSSKPMIFTCGSGLTACINLLAAEIADDKTEKSVYDGSWTEWAITKRLLT